MSELSSGKGHHDENFPVASFLIAPEHRAPIMAFYRFARAADDIADHADASASDKLARLAAMRAGLDGDGAPEAMALGAAMREHALDPVHANELLDAFVQDVTKTRYASWAELIGYCRLSAVPVGRFVLDVHGEDRATWPLSDALCAALQIVNHLQDCGKDARAIDRIYLPADLMAKHGAHEADLFGDAATPGLRAAIAEAAGRTQKLLAESAPFARAIRSRRLAAEVAVIQRLAEDLARRLVRQDPLATRVAHGRLAALSIAVRAALPRLLRPQLARRNG